MNKERLFDMIALVDDEYLLDASRKKRTIKIGKRALSLAAAAVICTVMLACAATAVVITNLVHKGSLNDFYDSSTVGEMESRGYTVGKSVENGHARLTVDSVMSDNYRCHPIITLEALDDETDEYLWQQFSEDTADRPHNIEYIKCRLVYADNGELIYDSLNTEGHRFYEKNKQVTLRTEILYCNDQVWVGEERKNIVINRSRGLKLSVEGAVANSSQQLHLLDGLEIELPQVEPVKDIKLYSQSGEKAYISELGIVVPREHGDESPWEYTMKLKDGSVTKQYETGSSGGIRIIGGRELCLIDFRKLIDPEQIESAMIFGVEYKRSE